MNYENIKNESFELAQTTADERNAALKNLANLLKTHEKEIIEANNKDIQMAEKNSLSPQIISRLKFQGNKLKDAIKGIEDVISFEDPLFKTTLKRKLADTLTLKRITCPIGVIGVIFESRPDAMVQIAALCIKSGNAVVLKGGSEAKNSNILLASLIKEAGKEAGFGDNFINLLEDRSDVGELLKMHNYVDLIIPRGSNEFVSYIMENSKIPVMGHSDGVCNIYVDSDADIKKAVDIIIDSKTQYVSACNAAENLLVHEKIAPKLLPELQKTSATSIKLLGTKEVQDIIECETATEDDFRTEYLDYILSTKTVPSIDAAIKEINENSSHHTDCIISNNEQSIDKFTRAIDSADVFSNCSTRFADGYRFGFGAEVGISTGKLHARGPVGLEGLITYKYTLSGDGDIVKPYAEQEKTFNFVDL